MEKYTCSFCGCKYEPTVANQKYCSPRCCQKNWIKNNPQRDKELKRLSRLRKLVLCRGCGNPVPVESRGSGVTYCSDTCRKESRKNSGKQYRYNRRLAVINMLGGAVCVYCGCDEFKALEINHKNGGGCREYRNGAGGTLIGDIYYGKKSKEDFEVTCRVCNAWHYICRKLGIDSWKIVWKRN